MKRHLTNEEIERYIDSEYIFKEMKNLSPLLDEIPDAQDQDVEIMTNNEIVKIEEHLLDCELCLSKVTSALDFSISFQQWLEEYPSKEQKLMARILKGVTGKDIAVKSRILNWLKDWQSFSESLIDVFMNTTYEGISNITKLIDKKGTNRSSNISFRYPVESFVMRGDPNLIFEKTVENKLYGTIGEKDILKINAEPETKTIRITCKKNENHATSPIVILIPLQEGQPIIRHSKEVEKSGEYEVSIKGLTPGRYLLAIEPKNNT